MNNITFYNTNEELYNDISKRINEQDQGFNLLCTFTPERINSIRHEFNVFYHVSIAFRCVTSLCSPMHTKNTYYNMKQKALDHIKLLSLHNQLLFFDNILDILESIDSFNQREKLTQETLKGYQYLHKVHARHIRTFSCLL